MTQLKRTENESAKTDAIKEKKIEASTPSAPKYINDKCIQIAAWVLLTLGLCIISTTFYMAIAYQKNKQHDINNFTNYDNNGENMNHIFNVNRSGRTMNEKILQIYPNNISGCGEVNCRITCTNVDNFYTTLYDTLKLSMCPFTDILQIQEQNFFKGVIKNSWKEIERPVYEILLHDSRVTRIKSDTFNSLMFSSTLLLSWQNLEPELKVDSGALLGLHSLKYLIITTPIEHLDRAFFQPVQMSLLHLRLNSGLSSWNQNIFGISILPNLEYIDLSHNNFNDGITRNTFPSTPNLKYLRMIDAKVLFIDRDAFSHLVGKLRVLNLSNNNIVYLDANIIEALVTAPDTKTFVNFALNDFSCGCEIYPFAKIYMKYRSQFIDALYCRKPYYYYGYFINEINYNDCEIAAITTTTSMAMTTWDKAASTTSESSNHGGGNQPDLGYADDDNDDDEYNSIEPPISDETVFEMRCINTVAVNNSNSKLKPSEIVASSTESDSKSVELRISGVFENLWRQNASVDLWNEQIQARDQEIFKMQPRTHDFELHLFQNSSVQVTVMEALAESTHISIIWFSDAIMPPINGCMNYRNPYFVTDALQENTTYTFCLTVQGTPTISPLDCLPLYVPPVAMPQEHIWISKDNKTMTLVMLCLTFLVSAIFGGVAAYFGIKYYPDLLEGSKNVLMVKKCDQTCYISTISEAEYLKNSSFVKKQQPLKRVSLNSALPDIPQSTAPSLPVKISMKDLEYRNSTSSCFEGSFVSMTLPDDLYETPERGINAETNDLGKSYFSNACECSPSSPPPLPKRNSVIYTDSTENYYPKLN